MTLDIVLLLLRILITVALYLFLGAMVYFIWRDIRASEIRDTHAHLVPSAHLVIVECDEDVPLEVGTSFQLRAKTTIGRGPTNNIVFPDPFASTRHVTLTHHRGQWWLDDHQSRNGTTVNDIPVTGTIVLAANDIIGVGRVKLRLDLG